MGMYTQTGYSTGKTLDDIYTEIMFNLGHVSGGAASYNRLPQSVVLAAINSAQRDIAERCPSIRKICIVNTTADKGWYLCPANMIPNGLESAYFYSSTSTYNKLEIYDREKLDYEYNGWKTASAGDPLVIVPGSTMYGNRFTFEVYPATETAGSWSTQPTGVYLGGAPSTTTTTVTGTATGGNTTTLTDTTVTFTSLGLAVGMVVWNVTDDGYGYISSIAANSLTLGAAMSNSATFDAGDSYEIITDFTGVVSDWDDDDEQYIFSSDLGTLNSLQPQANNILLEYFAYPINLNITTDYPQLTPVLQDALIDLSTATLAGKGHEKTRQTKLADFYYAKAEKRIAPYEKACGGQPFKNMPRRGVVRMKGRNRVR